MLCRSSSANRQPCLDGIARTANLNLLMDGEWRVEGLGIVLYVGIIL